MSDAVAAIRLQVSQGSRILAKEGILDGFGHVSCRSPDAPDRFLISRNLSPALVMPADVIEADLDGVPIGGVTSRMFLERFIHAEIYRIRPDVHAVVHSHAAAVLPFTVVPEAKLKPICHMCGFLVGTPSPFDVSATAGHATNMLVADATMGRSFAEHLKGGAVALMRGHGFTAVGASLPQAVYRAIYTVRNCEIDLQARLLGVPAYLSSGEAELCDEAVNSQIERPWSLWLLALDDAVERAK